MNIAGIDVGSLTTKTVLMQNGKLLALDIRETGLFPRNAAVDSLEGCLNKRNLAYGDLDYIVATGNARNSLEFVNITKSEITCFAKGVIRVNPRTRIIIDTGSQGIRVIALDENGGVDNFSTNDKCSAGTGCFLDAMAFALEVELENMGELSFASKEQTSISTKCTIFAESEVVSLVARGRRKEDIIAGLHRSVAQKVAGMVKRFMRKGDITFAGGVAMNVGVKSALEKELGTRVFVPKRPQIIGALGAALLGAETQGGE